MAAEHATKIYTVAIAGIVVIVAFLALTSVGHVIDAATQHFMLFYAGVFALIALCASVGLGLAATDRRFLSPGHRVLVQSAHRAASFGAVTFLIIHIVTEILAQRVHVLDAVIPFLSPFRTFYIGLGTIASDLIILLVITGIMRGRFNANGKAWRWRAIHYVSYLSFVFGIWHGLLAGRPGKPYVDWSYGFIVAFVAIGLAVRILSRSLRPKENVSAPPAATGTSSASAPMHAAALFAQLGAARAAAPSRLVLSATSAPVLSAPVALARTAAPMLTAPVSTGGSRPPFPPAGPVLAGGMMRSPKYEPGYEGPARYLGTPRDLGPGPMAADGPGYWPQAENGSLSDWGSGHGPGAPTGSQPRLSAGSFPRAGTGPMPRVATLPRAGSGPFPRAGSGPMPRAATGSQPRLPGGPSSRPGSGTSSTPRAGTGPMPRAAAWPRPRAGSGPFPRADSGPMPRAATGSQPLMPADPYPSSGTGPMPRAGTGPMPRADSGPMPRAATGPMSRPGSGGPDDRAGQPGRRARPRGGRAGGAAGDMGSGAASGQAPWDAGFPEPDPDFRYREPGPGMPGYRGSREHRYGGDVRP